MANPLFPAVMVNGLEISSDDIANEAQNHSVPKGKPGLAWRAAARALVIRELLLQEARRRDLQPHPAELEPGKFETDDDAMIRDLLDLGVQVRQPTEDAMRRLYNERTQMFCSPTLYEPAHILFTAAPDDVKARNEALMKAETVLDSLRVSPRGFGQMARELSECPSKDMDGQLGQLTTGDTVPEFEAAMDKLEAGKLCFEPVETRYGIHILRMNAKAPGEILPFEQVKVQLREMLEKVEWVNGANAFVSELVAKAEIDGIKMDFAA